MFPVGRSPVPDQGWAAKQAAMMAAVYPGGKPTSGVDVVEPGWTGLSPLPPECASITRYTVTEPGGRNGGTVAYCHLMAPSAIPNGKFVAHLAGHGATSLHYLLRDGSSVILRALAAGFHVLAVDLPNYGWQPQPQVVVINGTTLTQTPSTWHAPNGMDPPYDSPSLVRLYTDHIIRSMNQVDADYAPSSWSAVGHSGGGDTLTLLAALESRFRVVHFCQANGYVEQYPIGGSFNYESWGLNDIYAVVRGSYKDVAVACSAFPGRTAVLHSADADEYGGDQSPLWLSWIGEVQPWLRSIPGASISYRHWDSGHNFQSPQAAWIVAHLVANL